MHFKTLVTVNMPSVEEDPHENAAVVQSIELLQARKDDLAKDIMAELTLCSLMGRTTNFARQLVGEVEEVMAPYSAEPSEEYMEFADMTEELKADYAKSVDCLKLPNGKIVECGSYPYFSKYSIVDGKVSQNKVGPLHHTRRTKQSRKIQYLPNYPRQKVYKTFEKYAEDYRGYEYNEEEKGYGFNCNPNAMWDWYQIGGRWPVTFLVKADCTEYSFGERSWGNYSKKYPAPEGFMFIGTQCDPWGKPDGTGHEKIGRGNSPRLIFSLIPSLFERYISIGCADLIWDITLDEISALCLFIGRGPFFA